MSHSRFLLMLLIILAGCRETILHDLSETETNRIITKLHSSGIDSEKEKQADGKWSITVEQAVASQAIRTVEINRLIPKFSTDEKRSASVGASREEQKFSLERQMSSELEDTLMQISGVLESRVHLTLPATDPVFGTRLEKSLASASVLLIIEPDTKIISSDIAQLIAGASGIPAKDVAVLQTIADPSLKSDEVSFAPMKTSGVLTKLWSVLPMILLFVAGVGLLTMGVMKKHHVHQRTT